MDKKSFVDGVSAIFDKKKHILGTQLTFKKLPNGPLKFSH